MVWFISTLLLFTAVTCSATQSRVMGGRATTIEEHPSLVQIQFQTSIIMWSQACAGTVITSRFILSAAQCFSGNLYSPRFRRIIAGSTYRDLGGMYHNVAYAYNHPSFGKGAAYDGDISVVLLATPLVYSDSIQRIRVIGQGAPIPYDLPVVQAGWGVDSTESPESSTGVLQEVTVFTYKTSDCAAIYSNSSSPRTVTDNMLCAGPLFGARAGACEGDNGGPLYFMDIVIGIVSWGLDCNNATLPRVHTSIPAYSDWIIQTAVY